MTLFLNGLTSSKIATGIALCIIHDINVNNLGLNGFPQITITRSVNGGFNVTLIFETRLVKFEISEVEAKSAAKLAKIFEYDHDVFDRVQESLADLEGQR